jgi:hypothetical protein
MFNKLYPAYVKTAVALNEMNQMRRNPAMLVKKLEHGDADSSGSTLRTLGIVILVVLVVGILGFAVKTAADTAAGEIDGTSFNFNAAP